MQLLTYTLLSNHTGVLTSRGAQLVKDKLPIRFEKVPERSTAVFTCGGVECYRTLSPQGECEIPASFLDGHMSVAVVILDGSARPERWSCEGLIAERQQDGAVFISPDDTDLAGKVATVLAENDALRGEINALSERIETLSRRVKTMLEGYDLV